MKRISYRALLLCAVVFAWCGVAQAAVGPRIPVGPQAAVSCPVNSVALSPGASVQAAVNAHAAGTSYCFAPGTYAKQTIVPKAGDTYTGQYGAALDGQGTKGYAFAGASGNNNVTIQNLVVKNYLPGSQLAAIDNRDVGNASGWIIKNNEITANDGVGVNFENGSQVIANYIHDNAEEGYSCGGSNVAMTDNEIARNNPNDAYVPGFEAGGGKCWATTNALISYNYSHDNHGPGLWDDTDNNNITYSFNRVENNWNGGIFHEVSYNALIHDNQLSSNANPKYCDGWLWCGEI